LDGKPLDAAGPTLNLTQKAGTYNITLKVTDSFFEWVQVSRQLTVLKNSAGTDDDITPDDDDVGPGTALRRTTC